MRFFQKVFLLILFLTNLNISPALSQTNNAVYYFNQGVAFHKKGEINKAVDCYKKALSLNPKLSSAKNNLIAAYYTLANLHYKQRDYNQTIKCYNEALILDKKNSEAYYNLGILYEKVGNTAKAVQSYKNCLNINPDNRNAKHNLAVYFYNAGINKDKDGNYDQAIQNFESALKYNPNDAQIYAAIGNCHFQKGYFDLAINSYKKALSINPDNDKIQHNLDLAYKSKTEKMLVSKINTIQSSIKAPESLYKLVRMSYGVKYGMNIKCFEILDLLWSDPEGQKLLNIVIDKKIPIQITPGIEETNANIVTTQYKQALSYFGFPIYSFRDKKEKDIRINIGEDHIQAFKDPYLSSDLKMYAFHVFGHELCHAVKNIVSINTDNAISEELSASMIAFNLGSRIIKGRDLTQDEVIDLSRRTLKAILADEHRNLPLYNSFNYEIQKIGIMPPYLHLYRNLSELYNSIKNDPDTLRLDRLESQ